MAKERSGSVGRTCKAPSTPIGSPPVEQEPRSVRRIKFAVLDSAEDEDDDSGGEAEAAKRRPAPAPLHHVRSVGLPKAADRDLSPCRSSSRTPSGTGAHPTLRGEEVDILASPACR